MSAATVVLRAPLVLVPGPTLDEQLRTKSRSSAGLPSEVTQIVHDLDQLPGGAAVSLDPGNGRYRPSLLVHTRAYRLRLEATNRGTGYFVKHIDPLRLADHARLARSCLLVRPPFWQMVFDLRAVPEGADAQWETLAEAWQGLGRTRERQPDTASVSEAQAEFLDTVDRLIDTTEEYTTREEREAAPFPYLRVTSTGGRRGSTPQSMYEFRLVAPELPPAGAFVRIQGDTDTRGRVSRVAGNSVTVRFDQPVSWDRVPERGALELVPSTVVFSKQRQAVASLRTGDIGNPHLLPALVEHRVRGIPVTGARPRESLDPEQMDAFRKALATEDLLVVLGPPGTGKTRTITEIAHTAATTAHAGGGRVLVTSHTNRAVDNVLARLPRDLVVIRVGDESKVHADVSPLLLEEQSENLAEGIRHTMAYRVQAYSEAAATADWTRELASRLDRVDDHAQEVTAAAARLHDAVRAAAAPARRELAALRSQDGERDAAHRQLVDRASRLEAKVRSLRERSGRPLTGRWHRARARRGDAELTVVRSEIQQLAALGRELRRRAEAATAEADRAAREDPAARSALAAREEAERRLTASLQSAYEAAGVAVQALSTVVPDVSPPTPLRDPAEAAAALHTLRRQLAAWLPVLTARQELTEEWRTAVSGQDPAQLVPELVRYAHVVGATCIGAASRPELSGVEFDLGIVDEAGQIGVADALVPLTRVRRGVLVGDDRQLPPFLDTAVADWARETGDPGLLRLTSQSALEQLRAGLPASHVVQLTRQRRMPAEIADFVSASFYRGELRTEKDHRHTDPLFASPMAFVDTSVLPERRRREARGRDTEGRGRKGASNTCEARLLARLAAFYHHRGSEWVVIVPYLAQRTEVIRHLTPLIGDSELANASVGSVDSYQGGERDVVLYGFTRSNPEGRIGFLKELRRVNVAFTRAKNQLVLTGDLSTLLNADDPGFRTLAEDLHRHLRDRGDLRDYQDVIDVLDKAALDLDGAVPTTPRGGRP